MYLVQHACSSALLVQTLAEVFAALNDWKFFEGRSPRWTVFEEGIFPLTVVRGNSFTGAYGVAIEGDAMAALLRMLDELGPYVLDNGIPRKPWQMLRRQWQALKAVSDLASGLLPGLAPESLCQVLEHRLPNGNAVRGCPGDLISAEFLARYGYGRNGPPYGNGRDINSRHEVHLTYALAMGKPVPQAVIDEALQIKERFPDLASLEPLLQKPFLRGRFSPGHLDCIIGLTSRQGPCPITEDNLDAYRQAVAPLSADAGYTAVDDALYAAGLLKPEPLQLPSNVQHEAASNDLAAQLARELHAHSAKTCLARMDAELAQGLISRRHYDRRKAAEQTYGPAAFQTHANRMVQAFQKREVAPLLAFLDTSDDLNQVSKKFGHRHFGLKTLRVRSSERRDGIFHYCGMDAAAQRNWVAAHAAEKAAKASKAYAEPVTA